MVQFHQTRDARDEAAEATGDSSAIGATLLGRKEASPVARGDHDPVEDPDAEDAPDQVVTIDGDPASDWFDMMCDDRGLPFSTALALARDRLALHWYGKHEVYDLPGRENLPGFPERPGAEILYGNRFDAFDIGLQELQLGGIIVDCQNGELRTLHNLTIGISGIYIIGNLAEANSLLVCGANIGKKFPKTVAFPRVS